MECYINIRGRELREQDQLRRRWSWDIIRGLGVGEILIKL